MPPKDRQDARRLARGIWIYYERSSAHPLQYAITLRVWREGRWRTIHVFDNAHGVELHHEHRYVGDVKQPPVVSRGDTNAAMAAAMKTLATRWSEILDTWETTR